MHLGRLHCLDALKAVASQLIVLHHLAAYGPISDVLYPHAGAVFDWLYQDARLAVQAFLVVSGFLTVRTLAPDGVLVVSSPGLLLWRRYCRLAIPYLAAITVSIGAASVARVWMNHESVPNAPTLPQLVAHVFLLHDVLGYEALSAGVWYVAIDLQLFALVLGLLWVARRMPCGGEAQRWCAPMLIALVAIASLLHFNRHSDWDRWALYHFGAYGLGALVYWASDRDRAPIWMFLIACVGLLVLALDFRERMLVAVVVALLIGAARRVHPFDRWPEVKPLSFLARISYSLFLVHYPVCLLVNAAVARFFRADLVANLAGLIAAWGASIVAGALLYQLIERKTEQLVAPARRSGRLSVPSSVPPGGSSATIGVEPNAPLASSRRRS